ncbi:50S ribosomal protein L25/general stress protein Ctc [Gloeobacter kilaueensis]|uniref:Large ribosomal subunit protein bL25 n=1 Tax=Gloeobacter kilaueensis (strain ATCC BAA-2537 / CCAP 1431/1 / ULC 316 / JS1) TaxID=1183438 RepID=U5QGY2_GLOK1|nr:50S ribosomal protein L25/general stress protein Ctc [Gloeobacter kilaueensis]AGY56859.1 50S ribosomal protein L25/general stress protein Ctc [Gloeobacter kilaueensis JS1]
MTTQLTLKRRAADARPRAMRREGRLPAVLYGHRGTEALALEIDQRSVDDLLKRVHVNNTIFDLKVQRGWSGKVLLREVQHDTVSRTPLHLSFFAIAGHGSIALDLPLVFHGVPQGVKVGGGLLEKVLTELSVTAPPERVPDTIEVDVSAMQVGDILYIKDLHLPEGIEVAHPDLAVATVIPSPTRRELESIAAAEESGGEETTEAAPSEEEPA